MDVNYWTYGIDDLPAVESQEEAQAVWAQFNEHLNASNTLEALKRINRLLEFDYRQPVLWHWKSRLLFDLRELDQAARAVSILLEIEPGNLESRYFDVIIKFQGEELESALEKCNNLITDSPGIGIFWSIKADILLHLNKLDESALAARQALALDPANERATYVLNEIREIRQRPSSEFTPEPPYEWEESPTPSISKISLDNSLLKLPVYADLLRYGESRPTTPLVVVIDCADSPESYEENRLLFPTYVASVTGHKMYLLKIPAIDMLYISLHPNMRRSPDPKHLEQFSMHLLELMAQLPNPRPERLAFIGDEEGARYATYLTCKFHEAKGLAVTRGVGMFDSACLFPVLALAGKCCCVAGDRLGEAPSDEYEAFVRYLKENKLASVVLDLNFTELASEKDKKVLFEEFTTGSAFQHALAYACGIPDPANEGLNLNPSKEVP